MLENFILAPNKGATHRKKRLGAGSGSGRGATCCRGRDGQRSRSGKKRPYVAFEGGQMPLYKRVPKRGFFHAQKPYILFNLTELSALKEGTILNIQYLLKNKIVKNPHTRIYILGNGNINHKMTLEVHKVSQSAKEKIEQTGGVITLIKEESKND